MVLLALFFAFIIFEIFLPWFNHLVNRDLNFRYIENYPVFILIVGIGILIGLVSGIYPACILSRFQPQNILKGKGISGGKRQGIRKVLIIVQFIISSFFIISTLGVLRQVNYMKNKDLGFNPNNVIRFRFNDTSMNRILFLRDQLLQNPDIISASVHDYPIVESTNWTRVSWEGAGEEEWIRINDNYSDHHFTDTYKMELVEGEGFSGPQRGISWEGNEVIINEAAVKRMRIESPIGKWIYYGGDYRGGVERGAKIVGVVKDYHFISVHNLITPMMIRLYNESQTGWSLSVRTEGHNIKETITYIENKFNEVFPGQLYDYQFINEFHEEMYQEEQKLGSVIFYLSILAIFIACLGVYGMVSFTTARRSREIVIRKVLGSMVSLINMLFAKEYVILILLANIIAWPVAFVVVNKWLETFPYRIGFSVLPYVLALVITLLLALLSMVYRTTRAAKINPADLLRYE
jgi:putative ABC transport system permease protein